MFIFPSSMTIFMQFINSRFGSKKENHAHTSLIIQTTATHRRTTTIRQLGPLALPLADNTTSNHQISIYFFLLLFLRLSFCDVMQMQIQMKISIWIGQMAYDEYDARDRQTATDKLPDAVRWRSVSFQSCAEDDDHYDHCVTSFRFSVSFLKSRHTHTRTQKSQFLLNGRASAQECMTFVMPILAFT